MPAGHTVRDLRDPSHLLGVLASVLFLSLGAPFWFNVLKSVTSLKSAVAKVQEPPAGEEASVAVPVRTAPPAPPADRSLRRTPPAADAVLPPAVAVPMVAAATRSGPYRLPDLP